MSLLSEISQVWAQTVRRWASLNEQHRRGGWPDRNAEYLFYQTVAGAWPLSEERAIAYMEKAAFEAKQHATWTQRHPAYEEALRGFVVGALRDPVFRREIGQFSASLEDAAQVNSLALTLLKLGAPGVPNFYQGTELWDRSLVDPDNRRSVDFELRRRLLAELPSLSLEEIWRRRAEALPKIWLIWRALTVRRQWPELFAAASRYQPLQANGSKSRHVVAFMRGGGLVVVVPRLVYYGLEGAWAETTLELPDGEWLNELAGERVSGPAAPLAMMLRSFPVSWLSRKGKES